MKTKLKFILVAVLLSFGFILEGKDESAKYDPDELTVIIDNYTVCDSQIEVNACATSGGEPKVVNLSQLSPGTYISHSLANGDYNISVCCDGYHACQTGVVLPGTPVVVHVTMVPGDCVGDTQCPACE